MVQPDRKNWIWAVVFLFGIAAVFAATSYFLSASAVRGVSKNSATLNQLCMTGNDFRNDQISLWTHLLALAPPPKNETAEQKKVRADFVVYIHQVFALRDCTHVGR